MTLKQIEKMVATKFENVSQEDLLKAFAVVNIYKKQMGHLEKDVKAALQNSFPKCAGGIQDSLSFSSGSAYDIEAGYKKNEKISVKDINGLEMELIKLDLEPTHYIKTTKTVSKSDASSLHSLAKTHHPSILPYLDVQESLDFSAKVKDVV